MTSAHECRRLLGGDLRDGFDAGETEDEKALTKFLRTSAMQNQKRRLSTTWIAVDGLAIAGFVTLCPGSVASEPLKEHGVRLSRHPAPVLILARMATSARYRGTGVGRQLIEQAVAPRAEHLATEHGCCGVVVDPKLDAVEFYRKMGFVVLGGDVATGSQPPPMFLPLSSSIVA